MNSATLGFNRLQRRERCPLGISLWDSGYRLHRNSELERSSRSIVWAGPEPSAVILNDGAADGKTHPEPAWFCCLERFENLFHSTGLQASAGIADGYQYFRFRPDGCADY